MSKNATRYEANRAMLQMRAIPEPARTCLYCTYGFRDSTRFLANSMAGWPTPTTVRLTTSLVRWCSTWSMPSNSDALLEFVLSGFVFQGAGGDGGFGDAGAGPADV